MTTPPLLALAAAKDVLTGCLLEILRTIHSVATAHPHRVFGDHQGSFAVCLRDIPRPSTRPRRLPHREYPSPTRIAHRAPPGHLPDHPRGRGGLSTSRVAGVDGDVLTGRLHERLRTIHPRVSAPPTEHHRFDPRAVLTARLRDIFWITRAAAAARSPGASVADDDVLKGRLQDRLRTVPAPLTERHRDVLDLILASSFASIGKLGTRSRRRRAR
jgi:hypothetical protein